jgi:hypothetical protein
LSQWGTLRVGCFRALACDIESKLLHPLSRTLSRGGGPGGGPYQQARAFFEPVGRGETVAFHATEKRSRTPASMFRILPTPGSRSATFLQVRVQAPMFGVRLDRRELRAIPLFWPPSCENKRRLHTHMACPTNHEVCGSSSTWVAFPFVSQARPFRSGRVCHRHSSSIIGVQATCRIRDVSVKLVLVRKKRTHREGGRSRERRVGEEALTLLPIS